MIPKKKKVRIFTDSAVAIASLEGRNMNLTFKQRLKRKNYSLVESIRNSIDLKELKVELVKVKGHSTDKWNNKADKLAKEGSKVDNIDRLVIETPQGTSVELCWKENTVEYPTRQFVKEILDLKTSTEWRFTS